jgi:hypothetical protein
MRYRRVEFADQAGKVPPALLACERIRDTVQQPYGNFENFINIPA